MTGWGRATPTCRSACLELSEHCLQIVPDRPTAFRTVERTILGLKKEHGTWGARKIRDKPIKQFPMVSPPAISTIHAVLDRHGLVGRKKRRRYKAQGTPLVAALKPNELWCADYKGEFMLGNKQYCYPLTISDYSSRYLIGCEG